jgi:hypothetical protein
MPRAPHSASAVAGILLNASAGPEFEALKGKLAASYRTGAPHGGFFSRAFISRAD